LSPLPLPPLPLESRRPSVSLRAWEATPTDADALLAAWSDPDIARWTAVPEECSLDAASRWMAGEAARREMEVALDLAMTEAGAPGVVIGEIGLARVRTRPRMAEVGYWLLAPWRGTGRAAVALVLFTDWVLRDLPIDRLFARTRPDNPRSGAVAEQAGYLPAGALPDGTRVWVRGAPG